MGGILGVNFIHAEQYIHMFQPLKLNDNIYFTLKVADIIDKTNGSLYVLHCEYTTAYSSDLKFSKEELFM